MTITVLVLKVNVRSDSMDHPKFKKKGNIPPDPSGPQRGLFI
jgi:hypothetical protein